MEKTYSPKDIEQKWYENWENHNYFAPYGSGKPFCIMLPPPNVTGILHMGHGFQHTLMDLITRYQRMNGAKTLWQPGTDHAGISTQLVVEKQLEEKGISSKQLPREVFLKYIWDWKNQSGSNITTQMKRLGSSVDWSRERFTMDETLSAAVKKVFIDLYSGGLIYKGSRLVNWDPKLQTAISDLEVEMCEEAGYLWYVRYPIVDSKETIVVATTRPETILGDSAVAVNPADERYQHLIGKKINLPLTTRQIPIIADAYVDKDFGSGCVKITPAHDFNDYEIGRRHKLPLINIFTKMATLNNLVPKKYRKLERFEARKLIIKDLDNLGLLLKTEQYNIKIPRGEKSNAVIEPFLTEQWFVKTKPLATIAIKAVAKGEIVFVPQHWEKTFFQWMENIEDWCISRQLLWGHRIPAWYDEKDNIYVGSSEEDVRFRYQIPPSCALKQDEDVLDTWFSSALWPFAALGWPNETVDLKDFYPNSLLLTGFDIIFFWVARMIMMGLKFTGTIPFHKVIVTGLIRDSEGKKMSKSKGNVIDPIDIIDGIDAKDLILKRTKKLLLSSLRDKIAKATRKEFPHGIAAFGADPLRFTFCSLASTGRNIAFDLQRVAGYRNFCNKLWNAARFVLSHAEEEEDFEDGAFEYSPADQWILSLLQKTIAECHHCFAIYRFDFLANTLYDFVWHEYCDWYLEFSKPVLYNEHSIAAKKRGTRRSLIHVLDQILKLMHPIMPFITEEIWQRISKLTSQNGETIMKSAYPQVHQEFINPDIEKEVGFIRKIIQAIRNMRSEMLVPPAKTIPIFLKNHSHLQMELTEKFKQILIHLGKISSLHYLKNNESPPKAASAVVDDLEILIPLADLIDQKVELARLTKEISKLSKEISISENKLNNPKFINNAPQEVIEKEKIRLGQAKTTIEKLLKHKKIVE